MSAASLGASPGSSPSWSASTTQERERLLAEISAEFALRAPAHDRDGSFPFENFRRLHEAGLLALTIPAEAGGGGAGLGDARAVIAAVARGDASTGLVLAMQYGFQRHIARNDAIPHHLRARIARDAVDAGGLANALSVEPELGTPMRGGLPATTAKRTRTGWRINGHKLYSTGIPGLKWLVIVARIEDESEPRVGMFFVPNGTAGVKVIETWDHFGMRATASHDVLLENVETPADHFYENRGFGKARPDFDAEQFAWSIVTLMSVYDAVAGAARDWLLGFLVARKPTALGASLATLPRFQEAVGGIDALLLDNRTLLDGLASDVDAGRVPGDERSLLVKHLVARNAIEVVERAVSLTGNPGLSRRNPLERHYRDVLCGRVHSPQSDAILQRAGKRVLDERSALV